MRVIAGMAKGHRLKAPKGSNTRPTADRIRESLFSILGTQIVDKPFLDLCAGSGANGIEALSRGASYCVFIDKDRRATQVIKENLAATKLEQQGEVYTADILRAITILGKKGQRFAFILLDPPYGTKLGPLALRALVQWKLCTPDGLIIYEHGQDEAPGEQGLELIRRKDYGGTSLSFFTQREGERSL
ncbi:MAG: 16S rRNA (guanine(966)-N(2))-methyltransferase RsmD [Limnochordia bacterium]|jgi:16S rRNA (guanine966-N2)-methyltransferase